jgi:hypothetical protein
MVRKVAPWIKAAKEKRRRALMPIFPSLFRRRRTALITGIAAANKK